MTLPEEFRGLVQAEDVNTPALQALLAALLPLLAIADPEEAKTAAQACAAALRALGHRGLRRAGVKQRRWPMHRRGPGMLRESGRYRYYTLPPHDWWDHGYLLVRPDGEQQWVSEPYQLSADGLRQLVALEDEGWSVWVDGRGLHYPGQTVRVLITRERRVDGQHRAQVLLEPD
jgi:hypothetical protein